MRRTAFGLASALFAGALAAAAAGAAAAPPRLALGVDPKDPRHVVVWMEGAGLFGSEDAGETWRAIPAAVRSVSRVEIAPGGALLIATPDGLFRSEDGGRTFSRPEGSPIGPVLDVAAAGSALFAVGETGVFRSVDGGKSFRSAGVPGQAFHLFRIRSSERAPNQVVLVSPSLLHRSEDGGDTWKRIPAGPDFDFGYFAWGVGEPPVAFAANRAGLFRSPDGATSWKAVSGAPTLLRAVWAPDPASEKYLLVSVRAATGAEEQGLGGISRGFFGTIDGGKSWSGNLSPDGSLVLDVRFAPGRTEMLYVTTESGGVFRSANKGQSWRAVTPQAPPPRKTDGQP
jgi:photosystem II stability/assembly factor-like uncharacterized protein